MATFPPDLEADIQQKISTGQFGSRDEMTTEAIRVYRELETRHAQLKSDVQAAIDEADQGLAEPLDIEAIKAELIAEFDVDGRKV
jgi:Arc/MetJ-type ribon-helix-helix transcriptional regulator